MRGSNNTWQTAAREHVGLTAHIALGGARGHGSKTGLEQVVAGDCRGGDSYESYE